MVNHIDFSEIYFYSCTEFHFYYYVVLYFEINRSIQLIFYLGCFCIYIFKWNSPILFIFFLLLYISILESRLLWPHKIKRTTLLTVFFRTVFPHSRSFVTLMLGGIHLYNFLDMFKLTISSNLGIFYFFKLMSISSRLPVYAFHVVSFYSKVSFYLLFFLHFDTLFLPFIIYLTPFFPFLLNLSKNLIFR